MNEDKLLLPETLLIHSMNPNTTIQPHLLEFPIIKLVCLLHSYETVNYHEAITLVPATSARALRSGSSLITNW